jgi:hypothetical protein
MDANRRTGGARFHQLVAPKHFGDAKAEALFRAQRGERSEHLSERGCPQPQQRVVGKKIHSNLSRNHYRRKGSAALSSKRRAARLEH